MSLFYDNLAKAFEENLQKNSSVKKAGRIMSFGDGVITIAGLNDIKNNELIYLSNGNFALALNLEANKVGAILLNNEEISVGMPCYTTGRIVNVPVGKELLGRVVNPIGDPLDNGNIIKTEEYRNIESPAPSILNRAKVNEPLYTGIKSIDSMVPIGKGQRELIIGDRQTGKTTIATDTIINQKDKNVICVYVAIGQKSSTISRVIQKLRKSGAMDYTVVVAASAGDPPSLQYLAPYTGTAIAEYFMYNGKDVLVVYDDLSKHAVAYRTISLLLRRPSGREAYPGDIFYIHSRLLERSAHLSKSLGGGSMTALPIIETLDGDISAYIPTNVISITDGQIYLEKDLFNAGIRPAINVGLSVSRVGGSAQVEAIRKISSKTRLELAHYREMQVFARFGSDIDASTKAVINKGEKLVEALKQNQDSPMDMVDEFLTLFVSMKELIKNVKTDDVLKTISSFISYIHINEPQLISLIQESGKIGLEQEQIIIDRYKEFEGN